MYEAATGDVKFGKDAESVANAVFIWNATSPDASKVMPIHEYAEKLSKDIDATLGKDL